MSLTKREVDYEWAERKAYEKNLAEFMENPFNPDAIKRMQNYAKKSLLNLNDVILKVKEDDMFARFFVKDPIKQSIHENEAARFIMGNDKIINFEKLPASGKNSLFLHKGKIISKFERDSLNLSLKSLDFYWEVEVKNGENLKFYASHKYTNEEGGAQDHQFIEQRKFLNNAKDSLMGENVFFLALCEGDFYRKLNKKDSLHRVDFMNIHDVSQQSASLFLSDLDEYIDKKELEFNIKNKEKNKDELTSRHKTTKRKLKQ